VVGWGASRRRNSPDPAFLFPLGWFVTGFIFLGLSSTKREVYLLPLYPAAALMVGWLWDRVLRKPHTGWVGIPLTALTVLAAILVVGLAVLPRRLILGHFATRSRVDTFVPGSPWELAALLVLALVGAMGVWWTWHRGRAMVAFGLLVTVQAFALLAVATIRAPQYETRFPIRTFARRVEGAIPPRRPIVTTLREHSLLAAFYVSRPVTLAGVPELLAARTVTREAQYALVDGDRPIFGQRGVQALVEEVFGNRRVVLVRIDPLTGDVAE
jgi:4-amino-4-deoxy-L-arabinose transferase-like glycosyltransferase